MTITTEQAEALAKQAKEAGYPISAEGLLTLAAERDIANEQIYGLAEDRERWKERAERAEAEEKRLRDLVQTMVLIQSDAHGNYRDRAERAEAERDELRALVPTSHQTSTRWTIERDREKGEE